MEPDLFRFDDRRGLERKRANYFIWTVVIILLIGAALAAWLGSFYVIGQPERPESYRILKKLHKIEAPKRFALTAAPSGEFLNPRKLYQRYSTMGPVELARNSAVLTRNYIRNFQQVHGLVTYVVGRFNIMGSRELTPNDVFTNGVVALAQAVDQPELLMEHVFTTANEHEAHLLQERLVMGMEVTLERSHDLSAVVHVERLPDGRIQITAVPLLYGSYAVTRGTGTFSLEPPDELNLAAGWPIYKGSSRQQLEVSYDRYRAHLAPTNSALPIVGLPPAKSEAHTQDALVRVEPAVPLPEESTPAPRIALRKNHHPKPFENVPVAKGAGTPLKALRAQPVTSSEAKPNESPVVAEASPSASPTVMKALPVTASSPAVAITSTTGATWKTFAPGEAPSGRMLDNAGLREVANNGTKGERFYLKGQFVVNFADANRAVLRPVNGQARAARSLRVIVDYPAGAPLPQPGSTVSRDDATPYEITEVRRQSDGQLNVFVREIIKQ